MFRDGKLKKEPKKNLGSEEQQEYMEEFNRALQQQSKPNRRKNQSSELDQVKLSNQKSKKKKNKKQ